MQFIVSKKEFIPPVIAPDIIETLGDDYEIWTYEDYERLPPLLVGVYSYSAIPKCLAPLSTQGLVKSGVFRLQREFVPGLYGSGVYVVVIDTGVNYAQEAFLTPEGKTKIAVLWDQNTDTVYSEDEINAAILSENPYESIPGDEDGHGTFVASVICGNDRPQDDFAGVAPQAKLIVVKLKRAPQKLYDFYFIPDRKMVYSEVDVMRAVHFADEFAGQKGAPAVFCMALGCNNGSHTGAEDLSEYLDYITAKRGRAVVAATGNEANSRHHYKGRITDTVDDIEINVEQDMDGFYLECWALSPELFTLSVISPSGQSNPAGVPMRIDSGEYSFLLEGTQVTIDYRQTGRQTRDLLIFIRIPAVAEKGSYAGAVPLDFWPLRRYTGHSQPIEALQGELDGILACPFPFSLMPVCLPEPVLQMGSCRKKGIPAVKNRNALVRKVREVFICLRECRKRLFPQRKRCCRPENWCR